MNSPTLPSGVSPVLLPVDSPTRIFDAFLKCATCTPSAVAITCESQAYTYAELELSTRSIAIHLLTSGIGRGKVVAILAKRGPAMVASILGALRAGAAFAVIDATYPSARIEQCTAILRPDFLIICGDLPASKNLLCSVETSVHIEDDLRCLLDPPRGQSSDILDQVDPEAVAYFLFTSGTTGTPKCVAANHLPLVHFIAWQRRQFKFRPTDIFSMFSGIGHDPVLRDIFAPLSVGGKLTIPHHDFALDARALCKWIARQKVTAVHATPQILKIIEIGMESESILPSVRYFFAGGDSIHAHQAHELLLIAPNAKIINFYGATETPQAMGYSVFDPEDGITSTFPLGAGISDVQLFVMTPAMERAGINEVGQIAIRTKYLSLGYLQPGSRNIERDSKFVRDHHGRDPDDWIYCTGDYGYHRPDGQVVFRGRLDNQVKIRGFRVELGDIEASIKSHPEIASAVVVAYNDGSGEAKFKLTAYLVPRNHDFFDEKVIRAALSTTLPAHMQPNNYIWLRGVPLLPNGKVDIRSLPPPDIQAKTSSSLRDAAHLDERMRRLVAGIEDALDARVDSLDKSFLDLGGDSLSYIRASIVIEDLLGWLPQEWETKPLSEFPQLWADRGTVRTRQTWVGAEVTLLFRAVSIILIVMHHTKFGPLVLSATSTLFVISGLNFSRFLRPAIRNAGDLRPTANFILKFAIPAGLGMLWTMKSKSMHTWWLPNLFLLGTFFQNPTNPLSLGRSIGPETFWYLDVLAANLIVLAGISCLGYYLGARRASATLSADTFRTDLAWVMIGLAMAAAQVLGGWWDGQVGVDSVAPFKWFWMLALGVLITQANSPLRKWAVTGLLAVLAAAAYSGIPPLTGWLGPSEWPKACVDALFFVAVSLMIWVERIPVPRLLHRPLVVIASSTLFIYMVNSWVIWHMPKLHLPAWWPLELTLAVGCGIMAQLIWTRFTGILWHLAERVSGGQPGAPSRPQPSGLD